MPTPPFCPVFFNPNSDESTLHLHLFFDAHSQLPTMDIEEQLERAEKLPYPSLVGSSVKSADDSPHNNYIHPEKYTGTSKQNPKKKTLLNASIGASLDDLISEGALLGSEEDFDKFLDDKGNVRSDAKYLAKDSSNKAQHAALALREVATNDDVAAPSASEGGVPATQHEPVEDKVLTGEGAAANSIYGAENFSTPNLSEYQIDHQISDHSELLNSVQSYDLSKLPSSNDSELKSKSNDVFGIADRTPHVVRPSTAKGNQAFAAQPLDFGENAKVAETDSLHTPFFQRDDHSPSRSRFPVSRTDRSRSRSTDRFGTRSHLARGDSYKNTHDDLPSKYELPADLEVEEADEEDARESRQTRRTLGDSVAAAEEELRRKESQSVTRDPSLVTSGDYTNFNVDGSSQVLTDKNLYSIRSESSTNYLRSISRSRSRQPGAIKDHTQLMNDKNEKNDANPAELVSEGAYVSDDPYGQVDGLDDMMKKVLTTGATLKDAKSQKNLVNDVSAEKKETETTEQLEPKPVDASAEESETGDKKEKTEEPSAKEGGCKEEVELKADVEPKANADAAETKVESGIQALLDSVKEKAEEAAEALGLTKDEETDEVNEEEKEVEPIAEASTGLEEGEASNQEKDEQKPEGVNDEEVKEAVEEEEEENYDVSPEELKKHLESLPIYIFTSLAGGMQIVNRTNRLTTILQANGIKFEYRDLGTDEEAKKIWRRYAGGKTLPGVARDDEVIGNWEYIEEVNEDYRLRSVLYETL